METKKGQGLAQSQDKNILVIVMGSRTALQTEKYNETIKLKHKNLPKAGFYVFKKDNFLLIIFLLLIKFTLIYLILHRVINRIIFLFIISGFRDIMRIMNTYFCREW